MSILWVAAYEVDLFDWTKSELYPIQLSGQRLD